MVSLQHKAVMFAVGSILPLLMLAVWFVSPRSVAAATPGSIVINELMYHPVSEVDNDEFLELYNTTNSPIDLGGWCFTNGIAVCFTPGTTIASHGYAVISPNTARTQFTYNVTPIANYTGKLDNGGEKVTLKDGSSTVISSVTYGDTAPWPATPDGTGPSLELLDAIMDHALPASWRASLASGGTAGVINSVTDADLPSLTDTNQVSGITPTDAPTVTTDVEGSTSVSLVYKVMFEAEQTLTMYDDGAHYDGAAGDGRYGAMIPAQVAGKLVRYRVAAANGNGTVTSPSADDTITYLGYVVEDGATADIPIFRWYMDTADFTEMTTNHLHDDQFFPAVVAMGDQVFDSTQVRVKGESSVDFAKRKYKFELPAGYELGAPYFEHPMDEFAIQVYFLNFNDMQEHLSWKTLQHFGFAELQNRYVRVHSNQEGQPSSFYGHYLLVEDYDKTWRERSGYQDGALYKQGYEKKTRLNEDDADMQSFRTSITTLEGQELKDYLLNTVDIPNIINYNAVSAVMGNDDWSFYHNIYQFFDTEGDQRWSVVPWDLDNALVQSIFIGPTGAERMEDHAYYQVDWQRTDRFIENALFQFPEFRDMYYRRVASVYDELYKSGLLMQWFEESSALSHDTVQEDLNKWSAAKQAIYAQIFPNGLPFEFDDDFPHPEVLGTDYSSNPDIANILDNLYRYGVNRFISYVDSARGLGKVLPSQSTSVRVIINEINYSPIDGSENEYIELYNPNPVAVDVSNWTVTEGVTVEIPDGSVIPANSYALLVKNDTAFRAAYGGNVLVLGQYSGNLSNEGETIRLSRANGSEVSEFTYEVAGDWPASPVVSGYSIGLSRAAADEGQAACWAPSQAVGGTPGVENVLDQAWLSAHGGGCLDKVRIPVSDVPAGPSVANPSTVTTLLRRVGPSQISVDSSDATAIEVTIPSRSYDGSNTASVDDYTSNAAAATKQSKVLAFVDAAVVVGALGLILQRATKRLKKKIV
jgi:hypothetical protein